MLKRFFASIKNRLSLVIGYFYYFKLLYLKKDSKFCISDLNHFKKILIVSPHADDELIGCHQLIYKNKRKVRVLYCGYKGSNLNHNNLEIRSKEFEMACFDQNIDFRDLSGRNMTVLNDEIISFGPDLVMIPSFIDWHIDHRAVNVQMQKVFNELEVKPKIGMFQLSIPLDFKIVNLFFPMNKKEHKMKWTVFHRYYKSQKQINVKRFKLQEKISGSNFRCYSAEVFCILCFDDWNRVLTRSLHCDTLHTLDSLKKSVNNSLYIAKKVKLITSYLFFNEGKDEKSWNNNIL